VTDTLRDFIAAARWFGGKGREWTLTGVRRVGELPHPPPGLHVTIELAELTYDTGETELYQLPLATTLSTTGSRWRCGCARSPT
jgi:maltokinase